MPDQFTVPQFIDVEDKILGPLSARQFVILLFGVMFDILLYRMLSFVWFLLTGVPFIMLCGIFALVKVNGVPMHYFMLNLIQTFKRPGLRVWDKKLTDAEVLQLSKIEVPTQTPTPPRKTRAAASRLQELTLVINTGGVYNPEAD